jgi:hypothetical protein
VLQACHHNAAIRHAAIALGSLHEQSATISPPVPLGIGDLVTGSFALQQYNKAIQALLKPIPGSIRKPQQKVDVALITCILFACFDVSFCFHFVFHLILIHRLGSAGSSRNSIRSHRWRG